MQRSTQERYGG